MRLEDGKHSRNLGNLGMNELWRSLIRGDRVRVVAWPPELTKETMHAETTEFYRWLIDTKSVLNIVRIDEWGLPWGALWRMVDGAKHYEAVALNHGGLELVPFKNSGCRQPGRT